MRNFKQFKASLKKEWIELVRSRKLAIYLVISLGFLAFNMLFATVGGVSITINDVLYTNTSWYSSQSGVNTFLVGLFLVVLLILNRGSVMREIAEKKMVLPVSMGLKPYVNISAKYIVQILVPCVLAFLTSLLNAVFSLLFLDNLSVIVESTVVTLTFGAMVLSAVCVFATILLYMTLLFSLSALLKNGNMALIICLGVLLLGDRLGEVLKIAQFTPIVFRNFAMNLVRSISSYQIVLSSIVAVSVLILLCVSSILIYNDRNDLSV